MMKNFITKSTVLFDSNDKNNLTYGKIGKIKPL